MLEMIGNEMDNDVEIGNDSNPVISECGDKSVLIPESDCNEPHEQQKLNSETDPYIKISGSVEAVENAKRMMLQVLETPENRVILKMDVTHLEHPHIIGKGGNLIKRVMELTNCRVHFPDMNRNSFGEKSNQVSISGSPVDVERARLFVRTLIPVVISFDVPLSEYVKPHLNSSPEVQCIESVFSISIYFKVNKTASVVTTVVRCSQGNFSKHKIGIQLLMDFLSGVKGCDLPVTARVEIMQPNRNYVMGRNSCNIQKITYKTATKITFPDGNSLEHEKNSVIITGNIDCTFMAWQEIMNHLPVMVLFDVGEAKDIHGPCEVFQRVFQDYGDISIYSRPKPRFNCKTVVLKGPELCSKQLLQCRQRIFNLPCLSFAPDINSINLASSLMSSLDCNFRPSLQTFFPPLPDVVEAVPNKCSMQLLQHLQANSSLRYFLTSLMENNVTVHSAPTNLPQTHELYQQLHTYSSAFRVLMDDQTTVIGNSAMMNYPENEICSNANQFPPINCTSCDQMTVQTGTVRRSPEFIQRSPSSSPIQENHIVPEPEVKPVGYEKKLDTTFECDYYHKKDLATKAMHRPIETAQVPSSLWSGYGFSESMPAALIKQRFNGMHSSEDDVLVNGSSDSWKADSSVNVRFFDENVWFNRDDSLFSYSMHSDRKVVSGHSSNGDVDILPYMLWQRGLGKYIDTFARQEVDYNAFLLLNADDLDSLGVDLESRIKMVELIGEELAKNERMQDKRRNSDFAFGGGGRPDLFKSFS